MSDLSTKKRDFSIDLIKSLAIIGVILIHVSVQAYAYPSASFSWLSGLFWGTISRAAVPLFLMASGALMLDPKRDLSLKKLYTKNFLRLLVALFFWAFSYKVFHSLAYSTLTFPKLLTYAKEVLLFNHEFHLYYLHIMLLVYVFLPLTRLFVKHASLKEYRYALLVWFVLGILSSTLKSLWPFNLISGVPLTWILSSSYGAIGYTLLGYYIKSLCKTKKWIYMILVFLGAITIFTGTLLASLKIGKLSQTFFDGFALAVFLLATGIFGWVMKSKSDFGKKTNKVITYLSKASFCIYLVHLFFMYMFTKIGFTVESFIPFLSIPIYTLITLGLSILTYFVLSKIPLVNKWLI